MSADGLRVGLERLIAKWREAHAKMPDYEPYLYELENCADELAALLHAHPPAPTVITGTFCDYMIGANPCLLVSGHSGPHVMQFPDEDAQHPPPPDLIAQIRALPRYTVVDGQDFDMDYQPDGDWVHWDDIQALLAVPPPVPTCPFDGNIEPCPHHSAHGITPKRCGCCALGPCPEHRPTFPGSHNFDNPPGEI